jgi:hypothetical protein
MEKVCVETFFIAALPGIALENFGERKKFLLNCGCTERSNLCRCSLIPILSLQIEEYKRVVRLTWTKVEAAGDAPNQLFHKRLNELDSSVALMFKGSF